MNNEERDQALYKYSNSDVLKNKLDIRDRDELNRVEALLVANRIEEGVPTGGFDLAHLQSIHQHLFQDVYEWAGELRQVDFHKGGNWFHPHDRLEMGMADVHSRLSGQNYLSGLSPDDFSREAAEYIGDVNRLHPFREGNGRTQMQYLKQLGAQAGHNVDLTRFEKESWIQASIEANRFETERMAACIATSITDNDRQPSALDKDREWMQEFLRRSRAQQQDNSQDRDHGQDDDIDM